jgi:ABC-2 type transport system ATP-binding protein
MAIIQTQNLVKKFGDTVALNGVNLSVEEGELFGLLGVNGAGKTTLIRTLCSLTKPTDGDAFIFGNSILGDMSRIKNKIAISPQETSVAPNLTVRENLTFFARVYGLSKEQAKGKVDEFITYFNFEEIADRRVKTLSGGWQRRLSLAIALISDPKIIFLDEPTLGLDVIARRELWQTIKNLKGKVTVIITSHYLEEIESLCDRVAIMVKGNVLACGTVKQIKEETGENNFEDAFVKIAGEGKVI